MKPLTLIGASWQAWAILGVSVSSPVPWELVVPTLLGARTSCPMPLLRDMQHRVTAADCTHSKGKWRQIVLAASSVTVPGVAGSEGRALTACLRP